MNDPRAFHLESYAPPLDSFNLLTINSGGLCRVGPAIILSVHRAGTPQFPRYFISDQFKRVWTGMDWSEDEQDGLLYSNSPEACDQVQWLLMLEYMGKPVRKFRAPVYVDLFSDTELTKEQITRWLSKIARLLIDSPEHGNGPVEGTLGLVRIEWGEMKEIKK